MNTNQTNKTVNAAATNASSLLGVGNGSNGGQGQIETQLLECLERLDLVIANQLRLEQILAANGLITTISVHGNQASVNA